MEINRILIFIFIIPSLLCGHPINTMKIPEEHQQEIRSLFHRVFFKDHGVYTLFGDKPVSLSGDFILTPWENIIEGMRTGGAFWRSWEVWENYQNSFPSTKYLIFREPNALTKQEIEEFKSDLIIVINKKYFIKCIEDYLNLFECILNRKIDPILFLEEIKNRHSLLQSIASNEMILGILLGYGKNNASLFVKKSRNSFEFFQSEMFCLGDANLQPIQKKLNSFGDYKYSPLIVGSIHFMADSNNKETELLKKKYQDLRGKISAIYAQGDFLEITLSQLTSVEEDSF